MLSLSLILSFLLQTPGLAPVVQPVVQHLSVVVGLKDGQKLAIDDAQFTGFIETRDNGGVLLYRQKEFHGELKLSAIQRINFTYRKGRPYQLGLTLRNGKLLTVESDKRDFIMLKGATETGSITIKNPDPIAGAVRISTGAENRKHDQTIQYLEFPQ
jgi:hypothetical protein